MKSFRIFIFLSYIFSFIHRWHFVGQNFTHSFNVQILIPGALLVASQIKQRLYHLRVLWRYSLLFHCTYITFGCSFNIYCVDTLRFISILYWSENKIIKCLFFVVQDTAVSDAALDQEQISVLLDPLHGNRECYAICFDFIFTIFHDLEVRNDHIRFLIYASCVQLPIS